MPRWTQNCGVRRLPLDFRDQYFGCEIELTGINRATAAQTLADLFGTRAEHSGGGYDAYRVKDLDGKEWKIVRDGSIHPECRRRSVLIGETYKVELNSPKLEYGEMEKLQEVVRALRRAGGIVNDSCGMHVHVDASKHTPQVQLVRHGQLGNGRQIERGKAHTHADEDRFRGLARNELSRTF